MRLGDEPDTSGDSDGFGAPHPVVDLVTERRAIVFGQRPVIALSPALADCIARFPRSGRLVTLVTSPQAQVTLPVRELAAAGALQWVIQAGERRFFDAMSGELVAFVDGDFVPTGGTAAEFGEVEPPGHWQVLVLLTVEHRASIQTRLGGAVEAATSVLTGAPPAGWGPAEPVSEPWDRAAYTAFTRARMPRDTQCVAVGGGDRAMVSLLRAQRTERGVEEQLTAIAAGGPVSRPATELRAECVEVLRAASEVDTVGFGWVLVRPADAALTEAARIRATPVPLAMVIGPRAVRALGREALLRTPLPEPAQVGRSRTPGLLWGLGEDNRAPWEQLAEFVEHMGPHRLAEVAPQLLEAL